MKELLAKEIMKFNPKMTKEELEFGLNMFKVSEFGAKEIALKNGDICDYLFFCNNSISRCYYFDNNGDEQTLWMKPEQTFITEYKSFVGQNKSDFNIQFYEQGEVAFVSRKNLFKLYRKFNNWALFGINLTEYLHVVLIDVFVNLLANDATRNYQYIEYMFPRFIQVAPLKDIASMLQVSQVTLSRIRAGTQTKY